MKLVSIELSDMRRFVTPARIDAIGPGLNVLSAPNEFGKSTLFDALQALFFQPHRSRSREITGLKPHVGGAPQITVEVDLPEGRHTLSKRWLTKPQATVHRGTTLVAQADEAEAFISRLVQSDGEGGPAGLLWVRQGLTRLEGESETAKERETAKAARRNLMTSVAGEVESLTGGRRMDRALSRTREDLARYLTNTGRPLKGGPLAEAEAAVNDLATRKAELESTARQLSDALTRRREVAKLLASLTDPQEVETRQTRLAEATRRLDEAKRHAETLGAAASALRGATLEEKALADRLAALQRAQADRDLAAAALTTAQAAAGAARQATGVAEAALAPLAAALAAARAGRSAADAVLNEALRAEAARSAAARRAELARRIAEVQDLTARRAPLARAAATGPTARDLTDLQALQHEVEVQRALRDRSAPQIRFHHTGDRRVTRDGTALGDDTLPVVQETRFDMPGLGHFILSPGAGKDSAALDRAETALSAALSRLNLSDLAAAQALAAARGDAAAALRDIDAALLAAAPDGLAALEADLAALPAQITARPDLPAVDVAQAAAQTAAAALDLAQTAHDAARAEAERLRLADASASVTAKAAQTALSVAEQALAGLGDSSQAGLAADLAAAAQRLALVRERHDALLADAPDLTAAEAALTRARSVTDSAATEVQRLQTERASLDTLIDLRSGAGVMEELADTAARLVAAETTLAHIRFEVAVLQELARSLESARDQARDRYFEPVLTELRPLLRALWPDAELRFDGESLLPTALVRDGREEPLSILSGGTQEQIALLVRLAFARLLAARGTHAPIIFDDALVYTDDDRIEKMFDSLHAMAGDQQIIVLSCRQRAFRDLGGTALQVVHARHPLG
ncbi:AAA family ATPase [Paragemmobacter straminiformis]|uniref:AAA family ATPase n=1 Tax=Paragemmobacter straminiformis TaxID=2045119 RepID=A0A842I4G8_9RHOB|nr:ATP-binding protein [Gemmobacter straminiformis]MBC2834034.1 AAA family ATPase [Gemmobacter straminiformis]